MKSASILVLAAGLLLVPPVAFADSAGDFLGDAIKGDNSEIALGKVAQSKGATAGVRRFGRTLVADHSKAKADATKVASGQNVTPPTDSTPEAQQEESKLQSLSGRDFDREFADYMVNDHQKDIAKFESEAAKNDGAASAMAKRQLPTLKKHLRMAQSLKSQL